jgi:hypothetical protein
MYPTDYERLVNQLPQDDHFAAYPAGPAPVQTGHHDGAVISRYSSLKVVAGLRDVGGRKRNSLGYLLKKDQDNEESDIPESDFQDKSDAGPGSRLLNSKKRKRNIMLQDSDDERCDTSSRKHSNKRAKVPRRSSRRITAALPFQKENTADDLDSASENDAFQGPKKTKEVKEVRRSTRAKKFTKTYRLDVAHDVDNDSEDEN